MPTTFHLSSAEELTSEIVDNIKATFKTKAITITVEEDESEVELTSDLKFILDERLKENETTYLSAETSISQLKNKYGL